MYMLPFLANSFSNLQMNNHLTSEIKGKSGGGSYFCGEKRRNFSLVCFLLAFFYNSFSERGAFWLFPESSRP